MPQERTRDRIQRTSAAAMVLLAAVIVWAISALDGPRDVHPRFPAALQVYGVWIAVLAPLAWAPVPVPALGRLGLLNALGIGIGALIVGASRSGALLAVPLVCLGIALVLWPPPHRPEPTRLPAVILLFGGVLVATLPAAWWLWGP